MIEYETQNKKKKNQTKNNLLQSNQLFVSSKNTTKKIYI